VQKAGVKRQDVCQILISDEVYQVCIAHALMTEREEVMGLLLGDAVDEDIHIWASVTLRRSDKRADRVEISPEQLVEAAEMAEQITKEFGCRTRVVGWYHSHPHITCLPSHVDLRTQLQYQGMESLFIGLIFAVFNADPRAGRMCHELMAFRADTGGSGPPQRLELQPRVVPLCALLTAEQEKLATSTASTSLRKCWGHRAMSTAAEQSFAEIQDRHREEVAKLTGEGETLIWVEHSCRHSQQLNALLDREVVPLRQHFDDAVLNAEVLASVYRDHSDWVQKQPQGALAAPEACTDEPELEPPPMPPSRVLAAGRTLGVVRGKAGGPQPEAVASAAAGHGGSRDTADAVPAGCSCSARTSGAPTFCSFGCHPAVGTAELAEEPSPSQDDGADMMLPVTVPEETQELQPWTAPEVLPPREPSPQVERQVRRQAEEVPPLQRSEQVDLDSPPSSHAAASSSGRGRGDQRCGMKTATGLACRLHCLKGHQVCGKHKEQLKKRRGCTGQAEAGRQLEAKRQRMVESHPYPNFGEIETETIHGNTIYTAKPCRDVERDGCEPHPDTEDGQAPSRQFTSQQFGDAADSKAQQYLFGSKYEDLVGKGLEGGRARA